MSRFMDGSGLTWYKKIRKTTSSRKHANLIDDGMRNQLQAPGYDLTGVEEAS
jgi:hypothetical protein